MQTRSRSRFPLMLSITWCALPLASSLLQLTGLSQARWKESLYHHALRVGLQHCPDTDYPGVCGDDRCNMGARERAWLEGMRRLAAIDPSQAPLNAPFFPMMDEGEWSPQDFGICSEHVRDFMDPVRWAEYEYRKKAPPFPV